jgi:hypothetical protein
MPARMNGFGAAFVGEGAHRADGTVVTTEWVVGFGIPLVPLKTFRILRAPQNDALPFVPVSLLRKRSRNRVSGASASVSRALASA